MQKSVVALFLTEGDATLTTPQFMGITLLDRGRGQLDHHGKQEGETTASLVAQKLKLETSDNKAIQRLLNKVQRSDLQGESLAFDASDIVKCMQRLDVPNEEILEVGMRIVKNGVEFGKEKMTRDNLAAKKIIQQFLTNQKVVPPKFQNYIEKLNNPKFERPFDLVECLAVERTIQSQVANEFLLKLLDFEYQDSINYLKAIEEVRKAWRTVIREITIIADLSDNPRFKDAARNDQQALMTIQRNSSGSTQIYFDTARITDSFIETIVSMIRLEECLVQQREIPRVDLRSPEWVEGIPEWYYYKAPWIPGKKKRPGRFILNGSITAPDVPVSQIPLDVLREIATKSVLFQPFNWVRWKTERVSHYLSKDKEAPPQIL